MSILFTSFNAVLPYLLYLCLGHFAHRFHLMDDQFSKKLNSLIFRLFYPVTMFVNTYTISFDSTVHPSFLLFVTFLLIGVIALSMLMVPHFIIDNRRKGAVVFIAAILSCLPWDLPKRCMAKKLLRLHP